MHIKRLLITLACLQTTIYGNPLEVYLQNEYKGDHERGEIEILSDQEQIQKIQTQQIQRLQKRGLSLEEAKKAVQAGVIAEDIYWIWIRDVVLFPSGAGGTYNRLLWKSSLKGAPGVAILPILPDGKIMLNVNFRHATRSWELEVPRGAIEKGEDWEQCARRELKEETGLTVSHIHFLGEMAPDTGVLNSIVPVYAGWVQGTGDASPEESEAISGTRSFTKEELKQGLRRGFLEIEPQGIVYLRDSYLTFALFQLENWQERGE